MVFLFILHIFFNWNCLGSFPKPDEDVDRLILDEMANFLVSSCDSVSSPSFVMHANPSTCPSLVLPFPFSLSYLTNIHVNSSASRLDSSHSLKRSPSQEDSLSPPRRIPSQNAELMSTPYSSQLLPYLYTLKDTLTSELITQV
jgi:hypothetical protein